MSPTKSGIIQHVRGNFCTGNNEWYTPRKYIEAARTVMGGIDLDPASSEISQQTVRAAKFYTANDDGLSQEWDGRVWLNPPYAKGIVGQFIDKLAASVRQGVTQAVLLTHNATETEWFHSAAAPAKALCFPRRRIAFIGPDGKAGTAPQQGQCFFYYGERVVEFCDTFEVFGLVLSHARSGNVTESMAAQWNAPGRRRAAEAAAMAA